ncbi:hypothetical protein [Bullifex porci]|uniref:Uncharacterized protein n=1 Tax=Bullifex porci TaxID=2606638 RepID=A0A7X2PE17_9SPIO|nr:hypothetical protein [Bullifex porci]MDD7256323.1 hypothetical protein [Bullifex porci]MDD7589364.1 hypothetical protein [Bullifex porci]MDY2740888.1 hypothetical protein [Bullifex porci]MSU07169.1 hypothetical protein [Bullifex porci]
MNISEIMKFKGAWDKFSTAHPQFVKFLSFMASSPIEKDTVFRVTVEKPGDDKQIKTSIRITESDLELIALLKSMAKK